MTPGQTGSQTESKFKRAGEAVADGFIHEALGAMVDVATQALTGAGDAISCAGEVAADCGSVAVEVACNVAGSMLDGV